jgi:carbonic anhydrase/acetyltransferase-like protein (isoleucine patch superfamily)
VVSAGTLVMGVPAKFIRQMNEAELEDMRWNAREYLELWQQSYRNGASPVIG